MEFKLFKCSNCNNETLMEIHARNKIENGDLFELNPKSWTVYK